MLLTITHDIPPGKHCVRNSTIDGLQIQSIHITRPLFLSTKCITSPLASAKINGSKDVFPPEYRGVRRLVPAPLGVLKFAPTVGLKMYAKTKGMMIPMIAHSEETLQKGELKKKPGSKVYTAVSGLLNNHNLNLEKSKSCFVGIKFLNTPVNSTIRRIVLIDHALPTYSRTRRK